MVQRGRGQLNGHADDPRPAWSEILPVARLAVLAAEAVRAGRKTLVRCHAGYNRSGLVVTRTLVELGLGVTEAIALVRARHSPWVLHNDLFVRYLGNELAP
ncbi:protein-tyrosine phosphatase family protein [Amycolatopsis lexingtonensis]|uniref:protein-tyrosine phosphatase family protein n=1 Tax=Amycolatopsis lexingtonensis TaxID=218822 RepID=UPI003F6EBB17